MAKPTLFDPPPPDPGDDFALLVGGCTGTTNGRVRLSGRLADGIVPGPHASLAMSPEQAEYLGWRLLALAGEARHCRARMYPGG